MEEKDKEIRKIKEPNHLFSNLIVIAVLVVFVGGMLIILYALPSYNDYLIKKDLDSYGYYPDTKERNEEAYKVLFEYSYQDREKGIVRRPIGMAAAKIIQRYQDK